MLKRILCALLVLVMLLGFAACGGKESDDDSNAKTNHDLSDNGDASSTTSSDNGIKHTGKKLQGNITLGSVFSEGLAFVYLDDKTTLYCITESGYIVFETEESAHYTGDTSSLDAARFINGLALINNKLYDTSGACTTPESVGATTFYSIALEGGYILAEKVTADYSSTKKELGVMNTDFQWVVEPSESLYQAVESRLEDVVSSDPYSYYYQDYLCFQDETYRFYPPLYLNLKTGELTQIAPFEIPSYGLFYESKDVSNCFCDYQGNVIIDFRKHPNIYRIYDYVNGMAPVLFHNAEAEKYYFTLADESAEFLFDPVEIENGNSQTTLGFDGEILIVSTWSGDYSYNLKGKLLGEIQNVLLTHTAIVNNGIICHSQWETVCYYRPDFQPLFTVETE